MIFKQYIHWFGSVPVIFYIYFNSVLYTEGQMKDRRRYRLFILLVKNVLQDYNGAHIYMNLTYCPYYAVFTGIQVSVFKTGEGRSSIITKK